MAESFDRRGNSVWFLITEEVDGQLAFRRVEANTFDTAGRFTGFTESTDIDGDGVDDEALGPVVTGWDSRGRVTSFHTTEEDGAGTVLAVHDVSIEWQARLPQPAARRPSNARGSTRRHRTGCRERFAACPPA